MGNVNAGMMDSLSLPRPDGTLLHYAWFSAMHTRIDLALIVPDEETGNGLANSMRLEIARIEQFISKFDPASEVACLNRNRHAVVSEELFGIIEDALAWHRKTAGWFDITASQHGSGINHIRMDADTHSVYIDDKTTSLDFSGYAKGYALDRCVEIAKGASINDALLNFGNSSIAALGSHPCGKGWKIGIPHPWPGDGRVWEKTLTGGIFLTTSGNNPQNPPHIINPHTGLANERASIISVVSVAGVAGEALSTALFAAPPGQGNFASSLPECLDITEIAGSYPASKA